MASTIGSRRKKSLGRGELGKLAIDQSEFELKISRLDPMVVSFR